MNPLNSGAFLSSVDANPSEDDPESYEHVPATAAYADLPKGIGLAKDFRDLKRPAGARGRAVGVRPWKQIVGITMHQTATRDFAPDHSGLSNVPAHAMIHRDGKVSLLHHPTAYVQHGNALNGGTIGIEIACRAAGVEGKASTFWRSEAEKAAGKPMSVLVNEATNAQLHSLSVLTAYYCDLVKAHGGEIRGLWAHRQGSASRTTDPGSRIWHQVERDRIALQLVDVRDITLGDGNPIPPEWRIDEGDDA